MTANVFDMAVMGMMWGFLCGIAPLIYGVKNNKDTLGLVSLVLCAFSGAIFGVFLALPIAAIMFAIMSSTKPKSE